ncbi:hypothetical protein D3C81_1614420 [compost metagenome]
MASRTDATGSLDTGAADGFVVAMSVLAPRGKEHVVGTQMTFDEIDQLRFLSRHLGVAEATAQPLHAVHRQTETTQRFGRFLWTHHAQTFHRPAT